MKPNIDRLLTKKLKQQRRTVYYFIRFEKMKQIVSNPHLHWSCVRIKSGCRSLSISASILYRASPRSTSPRTRSSISRLLIAPRSSPMGSDDDTHGRDKILSGRRHSCDLPTSQSSHPRRQTISVAAPRNETTRGVDVSRAARWSGGSFV